MVSVRIPLSKLDHYFQFKTFQGKILLPTIQQLIYFAKYGAQIYTEYGRMHRSSPLMREGAWFLLHFLYASPPCRCRGHNHVLVDISVEYLKKDGNVDQRMDEYDIQVIEQFFFIYDNSINQYTRIFNRLFYQVCDFCVVIPE